jgi:hypothetical protein
MKDEHRERLDRRLTPVHLYKITPKTNCGECGLATCLAFATQVIVGQADLHGCPYLDPEALKPFRAQLTEQQRHGIGVRREGFEKALEFLRGEIKKWDFRSIAHSLGGLYVQSDGRPALKISYFGRPLTATYEDITADSGEELNPYEKILLYNYIIGGATEPSGVWVGMEVLPNSISKIKSLEAHCQEPLARAFAGKVDQLPKISARWGHEVSLESEKVDFAAEFAVLPNLSIRVLWWDEDPAEGFEAQTKFLFDSRVLQVIDLESLIFACEQVTDRLVNSGR